MNFCAHHERPGNDTPRVKSTGVQCPSRLSDNSSHLQLTDATEVVDQEDDIVLALERQKRTVRVRRGRQELEQLGHKIGELGDRGQAPVSAFVVDAHSDLDFGGGEFGRRGGSSGDLQSTSLISTSKWSVVGCAYMSVA